MITRNDFVFIINLKLMAIFDAPNARICSIIFSLGLARLGGNLKLFVEDDKGGFVVFADLRRPRPLAIRAHVPELQHLSIGRWDAGRAILMRSYRMRRRRHTHLFDGLPRIMAEPAQGARRQNRAPWPPYTLRDKLHHKKFATQRHTNAQVHPNSSICNRVSRQV